MHNLCAVLCAFLLKFDGFLVRVKRKKHFTRHGCILLEEEFEAIRKRFIVVYGRPVGRERQWTDWLRLHLGNAIHVPQR